MEKIYFVECISADYKAGRRRNIAVFFTIFRPSASQQTMRKMQTVSRRFMEPTPHHTPTPTLRHSSLFTAPYSSIQHSNTPHQHSTTPPTTKELLKKLTLLRLAFLYDTNDKTRKMRT